MRTSKAARRYGRAIFQVAVQEGAAADVRADVRALATLLRESAEFLRLVQDPVRSVEEQQGALRELFEGRAHPVTLHSLFFLVRQGRLPELPLICEQVEALYCEQNGILKVRVTSAAPLQKPQLEAIRQRLQQKYTRKVEAGAQVDPALLGGFKVHVGDTVLDFSIRTQLQRLREQMIHA